MSPYKEDEMIDNQTKEIITIGNNQYEHLSSFDKGDAFCINCRSISPKKDLYYNRKTDSYYHKQCLPREGDIEPIYDPSKGRCYDVYQRQYDRTFETIKYGFSWPAVFGGAIWAWFKGMVGVGFTLLTVRLLSALLIFLGVNGIILDSLINLGITVLVGSNGNEWRRNSMRKRGFDLVARYVPASNRKNAIRAVLANADGQNSISNSGNSNSQKLCPIFQSSVTMTAEERLRVLVDLKTKGLINDEEFAKRRSEVLSSI